MKSEAALKLECLKVAMGLASSKAIQPAQVVSYAMEFFKWVNGPPGSALDVASETVEPEHLARLQRRWNNRGVGA